MTNIGWPKTFFPNHNKKEIKTLKYYSCVYLSPLCFMTHSHFFIHSSKNAIKIEIKVAREKPEKTIKVANWGMPYFLTRLVCIFSHTNFLSKNNVYNSHLNILFFNA